jgi:hypothetical protein
MWRNCTPAVKVLSGPQGAGTFAPAPSSYGAQTVSVQVLMFPVSAEYRS